MSDVVCSDPCAMNVTEEWRFGSTHDDFVKWVKGAAEPLLESSQACTTKQVPNVFELTCGLSALCFTVKAPMRPTGWEVVEIMNNIYVKMKFGVIL